MKNNYNINCNYDYNDDYDIEIKNIIPQIYNGYKYYNVKFNEKYLIEIKNNTDKSCLAIILINKKKYNEFNIKPFTKIIIDNFSINKDKDKDNKENIIEVKFYYNFYFDCVTKRIFISTNNIQQKINLNKNPNLFTSSISNKNYPKNQMCQCIIPQIHARIECPLKYQIYHDNFLHCEYF
jgi:hypothetical protein